MQFDFASNLKLPQDAPTQTFAFLARRGAGKTYGATGLAEEFLEHNVQIVAVDPVGVWYGLRLGPDGKSKGYDIPIFGGEYGDIPLEPTSGSVVARFVVEKGISVILDVSHFRKNQRKQFCTDFAEELFQLKKTHRSPMHLFVEEAQMFVPQKTFKGEERMLGAFEDIIKLGRNYGIGATLISQRPQAVNKDVLNQTECLVVLQTNGAQERAALKAWMQEKDGSVDMIDELPGFGKGQAYVWSPSWLHSFAKVQIRTKRTFNASATPEVGKKRVEPKKLTPVDLEAIRAEMAESIAKAEDSDPRALQMKVRELERQLKLTEGNAAALAKLDKPAKVQVKTVEVLKEKDIKHLERAVEKMNKEGERLRSFADQISQRAQVVVAEAGVLSSMLKTAIHRLTSTPAPVTTEDLIRRGTQEKSARQRMVQQTVPPVPRASATNGESLERGARQMLAVLASYHDRALSQSELAVKAIMAKSGTFSTYLSKLRTLGYIMDTGHGLIAITPQGLEAIGTGHIPAAPEALVEAWKGKLEGATKTMLDVLANKYPKSVVRSELATLSNMADSGTFSTYLSKLNSSGLISKQGSEIRASEALFV